MIAGDVDLGSVAFRINNLKLANADPLTVIEFAQKRTFADISKLQVRAGGCAGREGTRDTEHCCGIRAAGAGDTECGTAGGVVHNLNTGAIVVDRCGHTARRISIDFIDDVIDIAEPAHIDRKRNRTVLCLDVENPVGCSQPCSPVETRHELGIEPRENP